MRSTDNLAIADEVFRTGRTGTNLVAVFVGAFLVAIGVGTRGQLLNPLNMLGDVAGAAMAAVALLCRRNSLVALFPEGLVFRNWRGEEVFFPWETVNEVFAEWRETGSRNSYTRWLVYVVNKTDAGGVEKIKLAAADSKEQATQLASALARAASLTHRDAPPATKLRKILNKIASTPREVWERAPANEEGQPSHPAGEG